MTVENIHELKNNEEFEVIYVDDKCITIKNNRLQVKLNHKQFTIFDLAYCITTPVSQGSTHDFPYSINEYQYFDKALLYTSMSRSTKKSSIDLIGYKPVVSKGYMYKITDSKNKCYIGSTGNSMKTRQKICPYIELSKSKELKVVKHLKL
jgi:hypothetical protein